MKKLVSQILTLALFLSLSACAAQAPAPSDPTVPVPVPDPVADNYRTFYQIFVGSFSDSNRDGIGDLRGIINRLDYLNDGDIHSGKSLGVQGLWLSPIFSSPSYHKYDAADYYTIDWRFGREEDLVELLEKCHDRNMKVILDLAINHTSRENPWFLQFKQARQEGNTADPYYDFYSCAEEDQRINGVVYQKLAGTDYWYECNFSPDMPELNFDNPAVRQAVLDIAKYYLELGVDGFRFDAVKYIYLGDAQKNVAFWQWYMEELTSINPEIYCVGECWSGESEILEYCEALNCFNFAMSQAEGTVASAAKGFSITRYTNYIESYQKKVLEANPQGMVMGFLSNHDMDRISGAFILESNMRMAANLYLLAPGSPTIYYGEEIGLRGSRGSEQTDANRRLAMRWGDDDLIRNPVGATYADSKQISTTVADQLSDPDSLLNYYCKLIALRHRYPAIARGVYTSLDCGEKNFGGFSISYGEETLGLFHNNGTEPLSYDLQALGFTALLDTIGMSTASLEGTILTLGPQTSVILK